MVTVFFEHSEIGYGVVTRFLGVVTVWLRFFFSKFGYGVVTVYFGVVTVLFLKIFQKPQRQSFPKSNLLHAVTTP